MSLPSGEAAAQVHLAQPDRTDFQKNSDGSAETDCIVAGCGQQQELLFTLGGTTEGAGGSWGYWRGIFPGQIKSHIRDLAGEGC